MSLIRGIYSLRKSTFIATSHWKSCLSTVSDNLSIAGSNLTTTCPIRQFRPKSVRIGWSQHVIKELLPCTAEIITSKARPFENIAVGYCIPSVPISSSPSDTVVTRRVDDSYLEIILPFADQPELRESMMRPSSSYNGHPVDTILYGKLFEILDALSADVAYRHCDCGTAKYTIVTASIDGFRSFQEYMNCGKGELLSLMHSDMKLQGYITYVGSSSMEVTIDIVSKDLHGAETLVGTTQFIMVARIPKTNKAAAIHKLNLDDPHIKEEFERGRQRAASRKKRAASSLSVTPPSYDEVEFMHRLYMESKDMKAHKNVILQEFQDNSVLSAKSYASYKWMKATIFKSVLMMYMQKRNIHGKIFGGYLLKIAYDLAYIGASCFFGVDDPTFICVDDVQFVKPVNIGSIMEFTTTVVYNRKDAIVIQVHAANVDYSSGMRTKTNILNYVFQYPQHHRLHDNIPDEKLPKVMPNEYDEFVLYLEGRRTMDKLLAYSNNNNIKNEE